MHFLSILEQLGILGIDFLLRTVPACYHHLCFLFERVSQAVTLVAQVEEFVAESGGRHFWVGDHGPLSVDYIVFIWTCLVLKDFERLTLF